MRPDKSNFMILFIVVQASGFTHMACWVYTAERQALAVRKRAFYNILHQHTGYFDKHQGGEINSILAEYVEIYYQAFVVSMEGI